MSRTDSTWSAWRIRRLLEIMEWKAKGLTDEQVAQKMPISRPTVSREINSPQARAIGQALIDKASAIVWPLVERQLEQIETGGLKPGQQVSYRGLLIKTLSGLVPKQIEQRIEQKTELKVTYEWTLAEILTEYGDIIEEATEAYTQTAIAEESKRIASEQNPRESLVSEDEQIR